jgi:hypothetical protein
LPYALPPAPDAEPRGLEKRYCAGVRSLLERAWCPVAFARLGTYYDPHADSYPHQRPAVDHLLCIRLGDLTDASRTDGARVAGAELYAVVHHTVGGCVSWHPLSAPELPDAAHLRYGVQDTYAPADILAECISTLWVRSRQGHDEETRYYLARQDAARLLYDRVLPALAAFGAWVEPPELVTDVTGGDT